LRFILIHLLLWRKENEREGKGFTLQRGEGCCREGVSAQLFGG
jgi:hypothetical protein